MPHRVCPWWIGYLLASPLRRWIDAADQILAPYVREGMLVLEPGPGMGFFTLELARRVGASGRVVAVDIQPRMLQGLKRRAQRAGLLERVDVRLAKPHTMGLTDLSGKVDFVLAFAVVHEMPDAKSFFTEASRVLKPGANLLLVEPAGHVKAADFEGELTVADQAGLQLISRPIIRRNLAALLKRI
jgi:ubiquinone/menaquinone biosynthesis C-methylase UbiE